MYSAIECVVLTCICSFKYYIIVIFHNTVCVYSEEWLKNCRELVMSAIISFQTRLKGKGEVEICNTEVSHVNFHMLISHVSHVITCEFFVITCEIYMVTCQIYVITCEIFLVTCEILCDHFMWLGLISWQKCSTQMLTACICGVFLVLMELLEQLVEVHSNDPEEAIFPLIDFSGVVNLISRFLTTHNVRRCHKDDNLHTKHR